MIKRLLVLVILTLVFSATSSFAQEYGIAYKDLEMILDPIWTVKIGCYLNGKTYTWKNENGEVACKGKNISIPQRSHLQYFKKYFKEENGKLFCDSACLNKIANRWALINFESSFNPNAISATNDYGYIQVHNGKDFLGEHKIQTNLDWLDNRWEDHGNSLCSAKYGITDWVSDDMYKCLMMRHNGRSVLNNSYSLRGLAAKKFYLNWFDEHIKIVNKGLALNEKIMTIMDKKQTAQEKKSAKIKAQKEQQAEQKLKKAQKTLLEKINKIKIDKQIDFNDQVDLPDDVSIITLGNGRYAFLDKETDIISILSNP